MRLERYVQVGSKRLRCGYTTGTCAAAAAKAAARLLLTGKKRDAVEVQTPSGAVLSLVVEDALLAVDFASCAVRKDAGDDADATDGMLIYAAARRSLDCEITIEGGAGIGRVTRAGLEQPIGAAAINRVPREMIVRAVQEALVQAGAESGLSIVISAPEGERIAAKTYNARLGIVGGISILGTTGIVEPMSEAALVDTIRVELGVLRAESDRPVLITPGNYGETFARERLGIFPKRAVLCSNFIGDALDCAGGLGFSGALLVGHIGKLAKLAGGIFNTHSRVADARMEILAAHAAMAGGDAALIHALMDCATTDAALDLLDAVGLLNAVIPTLLQKIKQHAQRRLGKTPLEAVLFSNARGLLGRTDGAQALILQLRNTEETE